MYSVYTITTPDGRVYVGATSMDVHKRWNHGNGYRFNKPLWEQIQTYGWDSVDAKVVASGLSETEASRLEQKLINSFQSYSQKYGYNKELGGVGKEKIISSETRKKMREACTGTKNHNYGQTFSEEHKRKISESNQGKKRSDITCKKIGKSKSKPVTQYSVDGAFVATYASAREAAAVTGAQAGHISKVCKRQRQTAGGYCWSFA